LVAPLDIPVVEESFILSPGENSEAPRVVEFELFIWVPGADPEAPFVAEPAKLRPDEPISIAAAASISVFFMSLSCLSVRGCGVLTSLRSKGSARFDERMTLKPGTAS
jgi:hypothetical protein